MKNFTLVSIVLCLLLSGCNTIYRFEFPEKDSEPLGEFELSDFCRANGFKLMEPVENYPGISVKAQKEYKVIRGWEKWYSGFLEDGGIAILEIKGNSSYWIKIVNWGRTLEAKEIAENLNNWLSEQKINTEVVFSQERFIDYR